ncbi:MAG: serine protease [Clostridiaceae bacterium]|nr:serine protease [Clostridiaceae bacterium]
MKRVVTLSLVFVLMVVMIVNLSSCTTRIYATDLMKDIKANTVEGKDVDERFIQSTARFSMELFKRSLGEENSLVSPLSVLLALSMTANGADNETLEQMEKVLGDDITIDELNEYLYSYAKGLPNKAKSKLVISNSIWFRKGFNVNADFLQKNADYYKASAYESAFDAQTVKDINNWVKKKTDGLIDEILDKIDDSAVMFLINAIVFDAEWEKIYEKNDIKERDFRNIDGTYTKVDMMYSNESKYISSDNAVGFVKPYKNKDYSFVAILPNEEISIYDYVASLDGETFLNLVGGATKEVVNAGVPKFKYNYEIVMNDALIDMGMEHAFDGRADFSKMDADLKEGLYISEVLHKTFISVDEKGTKAGAVTKVEMRDTAGPVSEARVILDRPFVYAIIDNATNLPLFIGTVVDLGK